MTRFSMIPLVALALAAPALALAPADSPLRKTSAKDVSVPHERLVLPNGLVVLLAPDPTASTVVVDLSFRAGTLYEPAGKSGLAHLTEHVVCGGAAPDTDYMAMLASRGAVYANASTNADLLAFRTVVLPEELPFALWASVERLGHLPEVLDAAELERHRRVVEAERTFRDGDLRYGATAKATAQGLFPKGHPLRFRSIGSTRELSAVTVEDVRAFAAAHLVGANGILTLVGNFDPAVVKGLLPDSAGRLPRGALAALPKVASGRAEDLLLDVKEEHARRPQVVTAWTFDDLSPLVIDALEFGALLLSLRTDGAFGTRIEGGFERVGKGGVFALVVTLPHDKSRGEAHDEAAAFLRYLTRSAMPSELLDATFLALDRLTLNLLDSPEGRATLLTQVELLYADPARLPAFTARHWKLSPQDIQKLARDSLAKAKVVVRAVPTLPLPPKKRREGDSL